MADTIIAPSSILTQLKIYLPSFTNDFTDRVSVSAVIVAGDPQILRITQNSHGYSAGKNIVLTNGLIDNSITNVSQSTEPDGTKILRFTTNINHDLTLDYTGQIELSGFTDSGLNTFFDLYDVPSRNTFEIEYDTLPVLNGNEVLREFRELGINGRFSISNIVDSNTYEIELTKLPTFDTLDVPQLDVITKFRMMAVDDYERIKEIYTKKAPSKYWLYVMMDECTTSKDRNIESDATQTNTPQNPQRLKEVNTFTIAIIHPVSNKLTAANAIQKAWSDHFTYLLATLSGQTFQSFNDVNYLTTFINHSRLDYNRAYYVHGYTYEYVYEITSVQTFVENFIKSRSYRDIELAFSEIQDGSFIDLDEE